MNPATVKAKLIDVLGKIQKTTKKTWPDLTGSIRPAEDLAGFDSKLWSPAIAMLSAGLGIQLPNDKNIFRAETDKRSLTIDEITALVIKLAAVGPAQSAAAPSVS